MASNSYGVPPGARRLDELGLKRMQLLGATQLMAELNLQVVPNTFARNILFAGGSSASQESDITPVHSLIIWVALFLLSAGETCGISN